MLRGLDEPLAQPEEHPGQLVARAGYELVVTLRLVDRLVQERLRGSQVVVVAAYQREAHQGACASRAAVHRRDDLVEHLARPPGVAGLEDAEGGVDGPPLRGVDALGRRQAHRPLEQVGRRRRCAARLGLARRVLERARDLLVGAGRSEAEEIKARSQSTPRIV